MTIQCAACSDLPSDEEPSAMLHVVCMKRMLNEVLLCVLHLAVGGDSDVKWPHVQEESSQAIGTGECSPAEKGKTAVTVTLAPTLFMLPMVVFLLSDILCYQQYSL